MERIVRSLPLLGNLWTFGIPFCKETHDDVRTHFDKSHWSHWGNMLGD